MEKKNILYAEDSEIVRAFMADLFEAYYPQSNLKFFNDGLSLEKRLIQGVNGVDLVITDNDMPGMNGSQLIRKYSKKMKEVPFILHYGGEAHIGIQALEDGAFAYLQKPSRNEDLIQIVKKALKI
jgi:DNA-binding NtrC family response regulator